MSYDNFHVKKERIFRVTQDRLDNGKLTTQWAAGAFAVGSKLKANFPEIEDYVKVYSYKTILATYQDRKLVMEKTYFSGNSFFNIFSYSLIADDPKTALLEPNTAVITEGVAKKLFGTVNAIGKLASFSFNDPVKITGVMQDASHEWLQTYAFRVNITWSLFVIPFIVVLLIAFATVSYLTVKAALMNPVKSLRSD